MQYGKFSNKRYEVAPLTTEGEVRSRSPDNGGGGTKSLIHPMGEVAYPDEIESLSGLPNSVKFRKERWPLQ